jgi:hypothetical protein
VDSEKYLLPVESEKYLLPVDFHVDSY